MPRKLNSRKAPGVGRAWPCYEDEATQDPDRGAIETARIDGWEVLSKELGHKHARARFETAVVTLIWFPILGIILTLLALMGTAAPVIIAVGAAVSTPILAWIRARPP